jgi:hypothetical protein
MIIFKIKLSFMRFLLLALTFVFSVTLSAQDSTNNKDGFTRLLSICSDSTPCLIGKSVVFAPIFPWFQYPMDDSPLMQQLRRYERTASEVDFGLMKANDHNSGYKVGMETHKQWAGVGFDYDTYNNGEFDQSFWSVHFVFRLSPRRHLQPKFLVGWRYIATDEHSGSGLQISFFNYDISFSRRFSMFIVNYLSWIKGYTIVEGLVGLEYYVYPTISVKTSIDIRHVFSRLVNGVQFGLSVKM